MTENETRKTPKMMTIRQIAATGLLPEHALRTMAKKGDLPAISVGNRILINYDRLVDRLQTL